MTPRGGRRRPLYAAVRLVHELTMMMGSRLRGVLLERVVAYDHELTMMIMMMMLKARGFGNFFANGPAPGPIHEVLSLMAAASAMPVRICSM